MDLLPFETALELILGSVNRTTPTERLPLELAVGRILAKDVKATFNYPIFDNSAMDGFVLRSSDTKNASPENPAVLEVVGEISTGEFCETPLEEGKAYKIFTGAPLPPGADAVIEIEKVKVEDNRVYIKEPVKSGSNIRKAGSYAKLGEVIAQKGEEITPGKIGVLAAFGIGYVATYLKPKVAIVSTGSELREPCLPLLKPGEVYNSNSYALTTAVNRNGGLATNLGSVEDDYQRLKEFLQNTLYEFDIYITTGGVSMGEKDFVKFLVKELGIDVKFHKVRIKPGKPTLFGTYDNGRRLFFGLPGNPVSSLVNFYLLVYPAIRKIQGAKDLFKPKVKAVLTKDFKRKNAQRREYIRVRVNFGEDGTVYAEPYKNTSSGDMLSMGFANGVAAIYEGVKEVGKGQTVEVILF
ncbi:MAG TPA: molybdopterin molybdenumtransferase MoeA [Aquifex aeolicus]|uniref:Molybdopterin molybdenumtransferase n=1 Tax=Aquifex aeolicus TaxID=63363 RepID=A0A9D0YPD0_AQUAO|nr:molybdopterin molybdotransferase MoeA [Aquificales bacterium]HIP98221.1 molybdopterin molybdenumtransferase MoeA [Aquifex aeolicus]HIQ26640.1 molybdopterin molybdenumtransferase MoeA [Aquifex aeolicus]